METQKKEPGLKKKKRKGPKVGVYLDLLYKTIGKEMDGNFIFRGQTNATWKLQSSAQRRLNQENRKKKSDFILYHQHLVENATDFGYNQNNIVHKQLSDLEILAEIQHHGGATCLTDFSTNFLTALWFATTDGFDSLEKRLNGKPGNDYDRVKGLNDYQKDPVTQAHGRVFILDTEEENSNKKKRRNRNKDGKNNFDRIYPIREIRKDDNITKLLKKRVQYNSSAKTIDSRFWLWKPAKLNNRIVRQDSIFMFGLPMFDDLHYEEIFIPWEDKKILQEELKILFNICPETVFEDLPGFSFEANRAEKKISTKIFENRTCLKKIKSCYKRGEYETAIEYCDRAIRCKKGIEKKCDSPCNDNARYLYYERGNSFLQIYNKNKNEDSLQTKALNDFDSVIRQYAGETDVDTYLGAYRRSIPILYNLKYYKEATGKCLEIIEYCQQNNIDSVAEFIFDFLELSVMTQNDDDYKESLKMANAIKDLKRNGRLLIKYFETIHDKQATAQDESEVISKFKDSIEELFENSTEFDGSVNWNFQDMKKWIQKHKPGENTRDILITEMAENLQSEMLEQHIKQNGNAEEK